MIKEKGFEPIIISPDIDETLPADISPRGAVMFLALKKALYSENIAIEKGYTNGEILIAADTVVVHNDCIIGKPKNPDEAFDILKQLCGNMHTVFTGVVILMPGTKHRKAFNERTDVYFKSYSDDDINKYAATPEPYDKAGGYAIQGAWGKYVDHLEGDRNNVMGFPWNRIEKELEN